ncbi:MAG: SagB/ThcOx family dehydrogenase [Deltaproteobacteria bacterium]|nr:SagB/ThcOx family dehydrogenase [Kofleriaceae bacterium]
MKEAARQQIARLGAIDIEPARPAPTAPALALLLALDAWSEPEDLFAGLGRDADARAALARTLVSLIDAGVIVVAETPEAAQDERFAEFWRWGAGAAHWFFGQKNPRFLQPEELEGVLAAQLAAHPAPPLFVRHDERRDRIDLPPPTDDAFLQIARARRSSRAFDPGAAVPAGVVADCLHAGLAIVGVFDGSVAGEGELPLAMAPSGGGRHPYEGFLLARRVDGLEPGVYHYGSAEHSLVPVDGDGALDVAPLLGDQAWFADAAAVIFLVAHFERTASKYTHPNALRVLLIEAGHIGQNVLLRACAHGLAATPTGALADRRVEAALALDPVRQAAVYAIGLGRRAAPSDPSGVRATRASGPARRGG